MSELWIAKGTRVARLAGEILTAADLAGHIGDRSARVGLKPNLVTASPASHGATTHPEVAEAVIRYLRDEGFSNLVILEGSWVGDSTARAFRVCGYEELSRRYGIPLIDTQQDTATQVDCRGMKIKICDSARSLDFLINLPVVKGHCQTRMTCALKNLKGLIPNAEKRRFHSMGLMKPIAHLAAGIPIGFTLADGICGDLTFEEGGDPVRRDLLAGGYDPVLLDAWAADSMGLSPAQVGYLPLAEKLGLGSLDLASARIHTLGQGEASRSAAPDMAGALAGYTRPDAACSACYANLIHALDQLSREADLSALPPVCIGQGYRGKVDFSLGVGDCCQGGGAYLLGCPPSSREMRNFLVQHLTPGENLITGDT